MTLFLERTANPLGALPALGGSLILALALACGSHQATPLQIQLTPPANAMPSPGDRVVFQVSAQGGSSPIYQWYKNAQPIAGANSASLVVFPVALGDAGSYQLQATDGSTSLETAPFVLEPVERSWVVTSAADSGPATLRDLLARANGAPGLNGIQFRLPGTDRITLVSTLPPVTGTICILGPYGTRLTVDGGGACRPLFLDGGTLVLDNFTLAHGLGRGGDGLGGGGGAAGMGGAIFMNAGSLDLRRMTFQGNHAQGGSSHPGGDGENGGGGGFGGDSPATGGQGGDGGLLGGTGGLGGLNGSGDSAAAGGGSAGGGGGADRGGPLDTAPAGWLDGGNGGEGGFGGGGGFSVGPLGIGGGSRFGGGGGGSGGGILAMVFPGGGGGESGIFGGDGGVGKGVLPGLGGAGAGLGGALFLREGSLAMSQCQFIDNHALPGAGDPTGGVLQALAEGKGGAVFIYAHDNASAPAAFLKQLQAQSFSLNTAAGLAESTALDNDDYYIADLLLPDARRGSPLVPAPGRPQSGPEPKNIRSFRKN